MNELFKERLKEFRTGRGLTKKQAAEGSGISITSYTKYENEEKIPTLTNIVKLADYFDVSIYYLMGLKAIAKIVIKVVGEGFIALFFYGWAQRFFGGSPVLCLILYWI